MRYRHGHGSFVFPAQDKGLMQMLEVRGTLLCRLAEQHANNGRTMVRDSRYVTNTGYSGAESLVISRFRCTTQERAIKKVL
jgi:hypothetical protein